MDSVEALKAAASRVESVAVPYAGELIYGVAEAVLAVEGAVSPLQQDRVTGGRAGDPRGESAWFFYFAAADCCECASQRRHD